MTNNAWVGLSPYLNQMNNACGGGENERVRMFSLALTDDEFSGLVIMAECSRIGSPGDDTWEAFLSQMAEADPELFRKATDFVARR